MRLRAQPPPPSAAATGVGRAGVQRTSGDGHLLLILPHVMRLDREGGGGGGFVRVRAGGK
jgi:hypothetical protein